MLDGSDILFCLHRSSGRAVHFLFLQTDTRTSANRQGNRGRYAQASLTGAGNHRRSPGITDIPRLNIYLSRWTTGCRRPVHFDWSRKRAYRWPESASKENRSSTMWNRYRELARSGKHCHIDGQHRYITPSKSVRNSSWPICRRSRALPETSCLGYLFPICRAFAGIREQAWLAWRSRSFRPALKAPCRNDWSWLERPKWQLPGYGNSVRYNWKGKMTERISAIISLS